MNLVWRRRRFLATTGVVGLSVLSGAAKAFGAATQAVKISREEGKLRIEGAGELFTEYHYDGGSRPFLYPILGPGGAPLTRNWPMKDTPGEEHDHPHHRSFWWAHGDINGQDFWSEESKAGRTVHEAFEEVAGGEKFGIVRSTNKLVAKDGTLVARDRRTMRFYQLAEARMIDFEVTLRSASGSLEFGDTKEGTMAMRINETMRLIKDGKPGAGHSVNSEGVRDVAAWGKRAKWVDYYGPVNGQIVGIAIFDHPSNPRHPTWWHVRDYGLFAANPFGVHDFEGKPAGTGKLVVPADTSITFRYRFLYHRGDELAGRVAEQYREYAATTPA